MLGFMADQQLDVAAVEELAEGATIKFHFSEGAEKSEGFVIRRGGTVYAWRNRCCHIPMTMDWVENRFLSRDGCHIQCATHGALYEIETGLCVWGPPAGEHLPGFPVEEKQGRITVTVPNS
ncbi:MAG: nitrite reductase/ring-hydroxylating ferredoxin subunit [Hyphomicrobiaceae bacterium]|jgi:nitrite reductase/ring-hydroxylating ferredoxin subunit